MWPFRCLPDDVSCSLPGHDAFVTKGCRTGNLAVAGEAKQQVGRPTRAGEPASLRDLTARAARGQAAAIEALLEQIRPMVVRYCRARLGQISGHYHVADDVAQEVCIAVVYALPRSPDMGRPFAPVVVGIS